MVWRFFSICAIRIGGVAASRAPRCSAGRALRVAQRPRPSPPFMVSGRARGVCKACAGRAARVVAPPLSPAVHRYPGRHLRRVGLSFSLAPSVMQVALQRKPRVVCVQHTGAARAKKGVCRTLSPTQIRPSWWRDGGRYALAARTCWHALTRGAASDWRASSAVGWARWAGSGGAPGR